uniref:hypothetical protein n=1 Tax=Candidatus Similichlamydia epinepheli TaxID=1903953 RepID=UPI00130045D2
MTLPLFSLDEIVIGLTAQVGIPFKPLEEKIISFFEDKGFACSRIRASKLLAELQDRNLGPEEWKNLDSKQFMEFAGDLLRLETKSPEVLSLLFINKIRQLRKSILGKHVIVLRSFGHPQEIALMRHIYKKNFFLIGVSASFQFRADCIREKSGDLSEEAILRLVNHDRPNAIKDDLNRVQTATAAFFTKKNTHIDNPSLYKND